MTTFKKSRSKKNEHLTSPTDFQIYSKGKNLHDFTQHRLATLIKKTHNETVLSQLVTLLDDYLANRVAVAWRRGEPMFIKIVKG